MVILWYMFIFSLVSYGLIVYAELNNKKMTSFTWYKWSKYQYCDVMYLQDLDEKRKWLANSKF